MKSDEKLWEICMDIYREMYSRATPKADFDKLIKKGVTKKENWFMKYQLPEKTQTEIVEKHCNKHKLNKHDTRKVSVEVFLGCAPTVKEEEELKWTVV